ncbi:MAG: RusA family crossover junction endodeoxyribonuclease [Mailhella sp.]|nr:RusA family crossover junction endodeoxyribonuclease [Mailhella sp.]
MSDVITFTLNATPTPQQRARHSSAHGFHRSYKSESQEANEDTLHALLLPHVPKIPMTEAVILEFTAFFPPAKSISKKRRGLMLEGKSHHTKRPDLDNICKQLKDAMTRMRFWQDDDQVVRLVCEKRYGEAGLWQIRITEIPEGDTLPAVEFTTNTVWTKLNT